MYIHMYMQVCIVQVQGFTTNEAIYHERIHIHICIHITVVYTEPALPLPVVAAEGFVPVLLFSFFTTVVCEGASLGNLVALVGGEPCGVGDNDLGLCNPELPRGGMLPLSVSAAEGATATTGADGGGSFRTSFAVLGTCRALGVWSGLGVRLDVCLSAVSAIPGGGSGADWGRGGEGEECVVPGGGEEESGGGE